MVSRARLKTNAETGLHGSRTSYTEYASDRNALLLRVGACVLRLVRIWRLITDIGYLYTIQLTAWTDAFGFDPRVSARNNQNNMFNNKNFCKNCPLKERLFPAAATVLHLCRSLCFETFKNQKSCQTTTSKTL